MESYFRTSVATFTRK